MGCSMTCDPCSYLAKNSVARFEKSLSQLLSSRTWEIEVLLTIKAFEKRRGSTVHAWPSLRVSQTSALSIWFSPYSVY